MKASKRVVSVLLAVLAGILMPLLVWVAVVAGLRQVYAERRAARAQLAPHQLVCSIDANCPPGYVCRGGRCVPQLSE